MVGAGFVAWPYINPLQYPLDPFQPDISDQLPKLTQVEFGSLYEKSLQNPVPEPPDTQPEPKVTAPEPIVIEPPPIKVLAIVGTDVNRIVRVRNNRNETDSAFVGETAFGCKVEQIDVQQDRVLVSYKGNNHWLNLNEPSDQ